MRDYYKNVLIIITVIIGLDIYFSFQNEPMPIILLVLTMLAAIITVYYEGQFQIKSYVWNRFIFGVLFLLIAGVPYLLIWGFNKNITDPCFDFRTFKVIKQTDIEKAYFDKLLKNIKKDTKK